MICCERADGWELIFQRSHAWLAHQLLLGVRPELCTERWPAVLLGTLLHDHGWREWETPELDQQGQPKSFLGSSPDEVRLLVDHAVASTSPLSLEGAVLVARHLDLLFGGKEGLEELQPQFRTLRETRRQWQALLEWPDEEMERAYRRLLWADTLSLLLCVEEQHFCDSLTLELEGTIYSLEQPEQAPELSREARLAPWPYSQSEITVTLESRLVPQRTFEDAQQLQAALAAAAPAVRRWRLQPG